MKKFVAALIVAAAAFAGPQAPAIAATDAEVANCLVFPLLKKECWELGADITLAGPRAAVAGVKDVQEKGQLPILWWHCTRAEEGSKHLLDC